MDPVTLRGVAAPGLPGTAAAPSSGKAGGVPFSERIASALEETNRDLNAAEKSARELAEGKGDVVETVLALSRAELSLRHVVTLRNRAFEAYQEIMRLQL